MHCCCCLIIDKKLIDAIATINGYSVCETHAQFMCQPFSDFAQLIARLKLATETNPSERAT